MNKTPIYTITTVRVTFHHTNRCVGYYYDFKIAEEVVKSNGGDINECETYPFAVIEEVFEGLYSYPRKEIWYKWNRPKQEYIQCDKPEQFQKVCGWGIG